MDLKRKSSNAKMNYFEFVASIANASVASIKCEDIIEEKSKLFKRILNNFAFKKSSFLFFNFQIIKSKD
jgi:hypothetical protein